MRDNQLDVNIAADFQPQLKVAVEKMQRENLDSYVEPESKFKILRYSSKEAQELINQEPLVDFFVPIVMNGMNWILLV